MAVLSFGQSDMSPWTSYSPALTADAGALGTGNTLTGAYKQVGKTVFVRIKIVMGASGIGTATTISVSLPVAAVAEANLAGYNQTSGLHGVCMIGLVSMSRAILYATTSGALVSANSQTCVVSGTYEAA